MSKTPARGKDPRSGRESTRATDHLLDMPVAAVIGALPDAAFLYDARGRIARASQPARRLFALDAAPGFDTLPLEERIARLEPRDLDGRPLPIAAWHITRLLAGETITDADPLVARVTVLDGRELVFSFTGVPIQEADGAVIGALAIGRDVTAYYEQRAQREEALLREQLLRVQIEEVYAEAEAARAQAQARAAQLEAIFSAIVDAVYVYDRDGRLIAANDAAHQLDARLRDPGYLATPFAERVATTSVRDERGAPLAADQTPAARVLRGEVLMGAHAVDTWIRTSGGHEVLLSTTGAPVRDLSGELAGGVIASRDATERHRLQRRTRRALDGLLAMAEAAVTVPQADDPVDASGAPSPAARELAQLARDVLDCARVAIVGVDDDRRLVPIAAAGLGPSEEEQWQGLLRGVPLAAYLDVELIGRLSAGEAIAIDTTPPPRADASFGTTAALLAPMRIGDRLTGILSLDSGKAVHQYTEDDRMLAGAVARLAALVAERERLLRERAAAQAQVLALTEANRRMDDFLGIAAHELRTPLTTTRANAQIALRSLRDAASAASPATFARLESLVARIEQQSFRQERLVNDLVDVSRIAAGRLDLHREPADLAAIARETVEEQRLLNPNRTVTLTTPPTGHTVPVVADADRVAQVITNYLTNALKYSHHDQPVEVSVGVAEDGAAIVRVRDHGPGLPPGEHDRVWERFHRVPGIQVRSGSGIGLGLGLYIAREIVARHDGRVGVESAPGEGATFWFTLPAAPDSVEAAI